MQLGKLLLDVPGVKFLLSEKFNQDPQEEYFSKERGAGGANNSPTADQFGHNMMSLYVASDCAKASKRGNCRLQDRDQGECSIDNTPLDLVRTQIRKNMQIERQNLKSNIF